MGVTRALASAGSAGSGGGVERAMSMAGTLADAVRGFMRRGRSAHSDVDCRRSPYAGRLLRLACHQGVYARLRRAMETVGLRGPRPESELVETPPHRAEIGARSIRAALSPQAQGCPGKVTHNRTTVDRG